MSRKGTRVQTKSLSDEIGGTLAARFLILENSLGWSEIEAACCIAISNGIVSVAVAAEEWWLMVKLYGKHLIGILFAIIPAPIQRSTGFVAR